MHVYICVVYTVAVVVLSGFRCNRLGAMLLVIVFVVVGRGPVAVVELGERWVFNIFLLGFVLKNFF